MYSLRKRSGLIQDDIAYLLSYQDGSALSQLEKGRCNVSLRIALAYQVLFGLAPKKLFPRKFDGAEKGVRTRAGMLARQLQKEEPSPSLTRRIALLQEIEKGGIAQRLPIVFPDFAKEPAVIKTSAYGKVS